MADEPDEEETGAEDAAEVVSDETDSDRKKTQVLRTVAEDPIPERGPAAYIAEFVGTFFLTFFICAIVTVGSFFFVQPLVDVATKAARALPF